MTYAQQMAEFVVRAKPEQLSIPARVQLKIRVLDSLGCAIAALGSAPTEAVLAQIGEFGGAPLCTLIGSGGASAGGKTSPDRAAFYNSALIRYLDFNDSYLAPGETCHPSDNLGAVMAACEYADAGGLDLMTALAVAYQVQCRLSDEAPVRAKGFDHTTQGAYAIAAGVAKALDLDAQRTANAIALCGTAFNALRVTRTGALSMWKGLAYPNAAFCAVHATFLAMRGVSGPIEVFEGNKGFMESIAGPFRIDWAKEDLDRVTHTVLKRYNAEIHSQSAIEGILELKKEAGFDASEIDCIDIDIFDVAFKIIGGGEEGSKTRVRTKEQADHSLPYLIAVALLDGQVMPEQYAPARIESSDVQVLLRRVFIKPAADLSERFPAEMPCRVRVRLHDGRQCAIDKSDYNGFLTRPTGWNKAVEKFRNLTRDHDVSLRDCVIETVRGLEGQRVRRLMELLQLFVPSPADQEVTHHGKT